MEENQKEIDKKFKQKRKEIEQEYKKIKNKMVVPEYTVIILENIIQLYNELYQIKPPKAGDKAMFSMLKIQYKTMCALTRHKKNERILK